MEKHWLGSWKGMLVGQTSDVNHNSAVAAAARKLVGVVHRCLGVKCSEGKARVGDDVFMFVFLWNIM